MTLEQELALRIAKFDELAKDYEQKSETARAKMQQRLCNQLKDALRALKRGQKIQPELLPVPLGFTKLPASSAQPSANRNLLT